MGESKRRRERGSGNRHQRPTKADVLRVVREHYPDAELVTIARMRRLVREGAIESYVVSDALRTGAVVFSRSAQKFFTRQVALDSRPIPPHLPTQPVDRRP